MQDNDHQVAGGNAEDEADRFIRAMGLWLSMKLKEASLIDVAGIVTGVCLIGVGVWAAVIYRGQLEEMHYTNILTQRALNGSDDTLRRTLAKMQAQTDATTNLYTEAQKQTKQATTLATNSSTQAGAATSIASITAQQFDESHRLIESQRASIDVAFGRVLHPITFSELGGMSEDFSILLKNNGGLSANLVAVRSKEIFVQWGESMFKDPPKKQEELCDKPPTDDEKAGIITPATIYKGNGLEWEINFGIGRAPDTKIIHWPPKENLKAGDVQTDRIYPFVIGCVDYQSGAMPNAHQTGFIFDIQRGADIGPMPTFINQGVNVPIEKVVIDRYFFSQGKSY